MKTLIAPIEDFIIVERTTLNADISAGSDVSLTLENNDGLAQNDYLIIGQRGTEAAELEQINAAVSGNTAIQVATLKFAHKKGEPVIKIRYNQRKFYGCATKTGTYIELSGSPVNIEPDDPQGSRIEYTESTYTYFKTTYYNSTEAIETDIADAAAVLADESKRYASIADIRNHAGIKDNMHISDGYIELKRQQAENEIDSAIFAKYVLPLSEIPAIIEQICVLLAAGYIDYKEFGRDGEGVKWLGEARGILKAIRDGRQRLLTSDQTELSRVTATTQLGGYPDDTIVTGDNDYRKFGMGDEY